MLLAYCMVPLPHKRLPSQARLLSIWRANSMARSLHPSRIISPIRNFMRIGGSSVIAVGREDRGLAEDPRADNHLYEHRRQWREGVLDRDAACSSEGRHVDDNVGRCVAEGIRHRNPVWPERAGKGAGKIRLHGIQGSGHVLSEWKAHSTIRLQSGQELYQARFQHRRFANRDSIWRNRSDDRVWEVQRSRVQDAGHLLHEWQTHAAVRLQSRQELHEA